MDQQDFTTKLDESINNALAKNFGEVIKKELNETSVGNPEDGKDVEKFMEKGIKDLFSVLADDEVAKSMKDLFANLFVGNKFAEVCKASADVPKASADVPKAPADVPKASTDVPEASTEVSKDLEAVFKVIEDTMLSQFKSGFMVNESGERVPMGKLQKIIEDSGFCEKVNKSIAQITNKKPE